MRVGEAQRFVVAMGGSADLTRRWQGVERRPGEGQGRLVGGRSESNTLKTETQKVREEARQRLNADLYSQSPPQGHNDVLMATHLPSR